MNLSQEYTKATGRNKPRDDTLLDWLHYTQWLEQQLTDCKSRAGDVLCAFCLKCIAKVASPDLSREMAAHAVACPQHPISRMAMDNATLRGALSVFASLHKVAATLPAEARVNWRDDIVESDLQRAWEAVHGMPWDEKEKTNPTAPEA